MSAKSRKTTLAPADDSRYGLVMFVVFSAAVLFVTGAVALLALVGSWWMLGAAFAVHVGVTAVVMLVVLFALGSFLFIIRLRLRDILSMTI